MEIARPTDLVEDAALQPIDWIFIMLGGLIWCMVHRVVDIYPLFTIVGATRYASVHFVCEEFLMGTNTYYYICI